MAAYLLNQFEFLGLPAPIRRAAVKDMIRLRRESADELIVIAQQLWALPEREFRYTAIDLLRHQHRLLNQKHLPVLHTLLLQDSWWETVDGLSSVISKILYTESRVNPDVLQVTDDWIDHSDFWIKRSAILHQLGWRLETDNARLAQHALHLSNENEFFIRKAIGWALRDYARWNPEWVNAFITENHIRLSGLTIREAAKHLHIKG
jgi:3-methyladenine DNA glycosylase AlkD